MGDINPDFSLYHLTVKPPSGSITSIVGNFTGKRKTQEIVRATQTTLELWSLHKPTRKVTRVHWEHAFANIRKIAVLKHATSEKDLVVVTSDSGIVSVIEYDELLKKFQLKMSSTYFKTGISRLSAGEYISIDTTGRAILITAIEKNKLAYTINSDGLTSPVEFKKSGTLTFDITSVDVGYENPLFAAIETEYNDEKSLGGTNKRLSFYEFDLGLNNISVLESTIVDQTANHIVAIPGSFNGPSGILLCSEGVIEYRFPFKGVIRCRIPTRNQSVNEPSIIVSSVSHKMKDEFFVLLQNQFGDVFKVGVEYSATQEARIEVWDGVNGPGLVTCLKVRYFDTIPLCTSMVILKSGFMFADYETGDTETYQFEKLGDDVDEREWSSLDVNEDIDMGFDVKENENIIAVEKNHDLNQMIELKMDSTHTVGALPEMYAVTGQNSNSAIKIMHEYLPLTEIVTQDLPSKILNVFTCKLKKDDEFDGMIVLSFFDGSLILSVGEEVEEMEDSKFIDSVPTIGVCQIGGYSVVQIHATGMKQVLSTKEGTVSDVIDWNPPPGIEVIVSAYTNTQVVLGLSNGELVYFEKNEVDDKLIENEQHYSFNSSITGICISEIPNGRMRAPFVVVSCKDSSVHVLATDPDGVKKLHVGKLPYKCSSLAITTHTDSLNDSKSTFLHCGMDNGVYTRYVIERDGELSNEISKFVVAAPLRVKPVSVCNSKGDVVTVMSLISTISFLVVPQQHGVKLVSLPTPEKYIEEPNEEEGDDEDDEEKEETVYAKSYGFIASLHSGDVPQGLLLTHGERLTIASVLPFQRIEDIEEDDDCERVVYEALSNVSSIESVPLRYTPRSMCKSLNEANKMTYIACSDPHRASVVDKPVDIENGEVVSYGEPDSLHKFDNSINSASCIHVYSNENAGVGQTVELVDDERAVRLGTAIMRHGGVTCEYLFVSTVNDKLNESFVRVYKIEDDGSVVFVYKHSVVSTVLAIHGFHGYIILCCGNEIGVYELGSLQLLKKGGVRVDDGVRMIVDVKSSGYRLFVSDISASVRVVDFDPVDMSLVVVVNDTVNRHVTRSHVVDEDTVIVGDKFGTVTVLRVPEMNIDVVRGRMRSNTNASTEKFKLMSSFYVGDVITSIGMHKLGPGSDEVVLYGGINGTVGVFGTLNTVKESNFLKELEKQMRRVYDASIVGGRDQLKFRSYYVPKRACIDGDFVEQFLNMHDNVRNGIAEAMDVEVKKIDDKLLEMRVRVGV